MGMVNSMGREGLVEKKITNKIKIFFNVIKLLPLSLFYYDLICKTCFSHIFHACHQRVHYTQFSPCSAPFFLSIMPYVGIFFYRNITYKLMHYCTSIFSRGHKFPWLCLQLNNLPVLSPSGATGNGLHGKDRKCHM